MKVGDVYESPSGMSFTIAAFDKKTITVDVERVVHKMGKQVTEVRQRVMPLGQRFEVFARPYTKLNGRKRPTNDQALPVRRDTASPWPKS